MGVRSLGRLLRPWRWTSSTQSHTTMGASLEALFTQNQQAGWTQFLPLKALPWQQPCRDCGMSTRNRLPRHGRHADTRKPSTLKRTRSRTERTDTCRTTPARRYIWHGISTGAEEARAERAAMTLGTTAHVQQTSGSGGPHAHEMVEAAVLVTAFTIDTPMAIDFSECTSPRLIKPASFRRPSGASCHILVAACVPMTITKAAIET